MRSFGNEGCVTGSKDDTALNQLVINNFRIGKKKPVSIFRIELRPGGTSAELLVYHVGQPSVGCIFPV